MSFKAFMKKMEEVVTIAHTPQDDDSLVHQMTSSFQIAQQRNSLSPFGTIKNIEMISSPYPHGKIIFFLHQNQPVGFCHLQKQNWPEGPDKISLIYLTEPFRKQGIGTAFHEFLLNHGYELLPDTHQTIAMQSLWKKLAAKHQEVEKNGKTILRKKI